jgi:DNA-binding MarR family transcriptional regulator
MTNPIIARSRAGTYSGLRHAHLLAQLLGDRIAREHGLTMQQWELLHRLRRAGGEEDQRELCCRFGVTPPTFTALVDTAERRGWIERLPHPADRRRRRLALTPAGAALVAAAPDLGRELERCMTEGLSEDERRALAALLERAARGLEEACSCRG